nr:UTRA domain-containing protein [Micromonospora sp. DSM 115978]
LVQRGRVPTVARGTLVAAPASDADSDLLDVPVGAPLLIEWRVVHDQDDQPVECTETRYVGDRYVFDVELLSATAPNAAGG